jgi:positive regulator of sigma E activity
MVKYDRAVITAFAEKLYAQARTIVVLCGLMGLILGGIVGFAVAGRSEPNWVMIGSLSLLSTGLGIAIGNARAFALRLQAQTALCQAQIEENTAAGRLLLEVRARSA